MKANSVTAIGAHALHIAFLLPVVAALGCSSSDPAGPGVGCGPGTVLADGVCVPEPVDDAGTHLDASADTTPATDSANPELDTSVVPDDTGAKKDAAADALDGAMCMGLDINCGTSCGGPSSSCAQIDCRNTSGFWHEIDLRGPADRFVIRLPDKPGWDAACATQCGDKKLAYQVWFNIKADTNTYLRTRVPSGWNLLGMKCDPNPLAGSETCRVLKTVSAGTSYLRIVGTTDPIAPGGDIVIEESVTALTCP